MTDTLNQLLPEAHSPGIYLYKVQLPIITHASPFHSARLISQYGGIGAGQAKIKGFALHVHAFGSHSFAPLAKLFVGCGGAVSGDNVHFAVIIDLAEQVIQKVHQFGVDGMDVARAVVQ